MVENDEKYETVEFQSVQSLDTLSKEEILERIKEGGVVGYGRRRFSYSCKTGS